jgi:hypothetical protein
MWTGSGGPRVAGGVLKGFGVFFIVLGSLAIVVGLVSAAFGAYMANEEDNRGFFGNEDKAEGGAYLGFGGLALAGVGVVALLLGILLFALGAGQARRELMRAVAARPTPTAAPVTVPVEPSAQAPPPPPQAATVPAAAAAPSRAFDARVAGIVLALTLGVLLAFLLFSPGGPGTGLVGGERPAAVQTETFEDTYQGYGAPLLSMASSAGPQHEMRLERDGLAVVRASVNWSAGPSTQTLVLTVEAQDGDRGEWVPLAQGEGGPGLTVESSPAAVRNLVRARLSFGGAGGAGTVDYALTLTVIPT